MRQKCGFTIMEIIIVVVILGILAATAIPKVLGPNEFVISNEGRQTLITLLSSQKRYQLENGAYANQLSDLDIDPYPASRYFDPPQPSLGVGNPLRVGTVRRNDTTYTLRIDVNGLITCNGAGCAAIHCNLGGGGNECNP